MKKSYPAAAYFFLIFTLSVGLTLNFGFMLSESRSKVSEITEELTERAIPDSLSEIKVGVSMLNFRREFERAMFSESASIQNESEYNAIKIYNLIKEGDDEKAKVILESAIELIGLKNTIGKDSAKIKWSLIDSVIDKHIEYISTYSFNKISDKLNDVKKNVDEDKSMLNAFSALGAILQAFALIAIFSLFVRPLAKLEKYIENKNHLSDDDGANPGIISSRIQEIFSLQNAVQRLHATTSENKKMHKVIAAEMEKAKVSAEEKAEFLSSMSHEIKTPLSTIVGVVHMLEQSELNDVQKRYVSRMARSSHHLNEIVGRVLIMSRMDANKFELEYAPFNIEELIEDVCSITEPVIAKKHLKFHTYIDRAIPRILIGDKLNIKEILINFTNNAIKFTSSGTVRIEVRLESKDNHKAVVKFAVIDTGHGVPAEDVPMLFQRFSQVNKRRFSGSGLGLAISKGLSELMGGSVGVETNKGIGSTFWATVVLNIPKTTELESLDIVEEVAEKRKATSVRIGRPVDCEIQKLLKRIYILARNELPAATHIWLQNEQKLMDHIRENDAVLGDLFRGFNLHEAANNLSLIINEPGDLIEDDCIDTSIKPLILVIDDTPSNLDLFSLWFDKFSFVKVTPNPDRGILIAKTCKDISLIILDVSMPFKNGFDVIAELKADPVTKDIPVIMISASESEDTRSRSIACGAVEFIDRGKTPDKIEAIVRNYLPKSISDIIGT